MILHCSRTTPLVSLSPVQVPSFTQDQVSREPRSPNTADGTVRDRRSSLGGIGGIPPRESRKPNQVSTVKQLAFLYSAPRISLGPTGVAVPVYGMVTNEVAWMDRRAFVFLEVRKNNITT